MKNAKPADPVVYSVREVGRMLHTNVGFVYELIRRGILPALKLGSLRVRKEALEEFLRRYEGMDLSDLKNIKPLSQVS